MRRKLKTPRILKIERIDGFKIYCMFSNGESKLIDFNSIFKEWDLTPNDIEYPLLKKKEFQKVKLRNYTLSWDNITVLLMTEEGTEEKFPYPTLVQLRFWIPLGLFDEAIQEPLSCKPP